MFEEEFVLFPEMDDEYRAAYTSEDLKIKYILPYITDGPQDLARCIVHEWIHGLIDWALDDDITREIWCLKNGHDPSGDGDHFIMRLINYD